MGYDVLPLFTVPRRMVRPELLRDLGVRNTYFDTDVQRFLRVIETECKARSSTVCGVIAGAEPAVEIAAVLAHRLGLPGLNPAITSALRNKDDMRFALASQGRPTPKYQVCGSASAAHQAATTMGYPLVCKRPSGAGGCGVALVANADELDAYLTNAFEDNLFGQKTDRILCESYLPGEEFIVDLFADGTGEFGVMGVWKYYYFKGLVKNIYRSIDPTCDDAVALINEAKACCAALGITLGPVHCELKMEPGERPVLVEAGARLAGANVPELYRLGGNFDPFALTILAFTQGHCDLTRIKKTNRHIASVFPTFEIPDDVGVLTTLHGRSIVEGLESCLRFEQSKSVGDVVQSDTSLNDQWVNILMAHDDPEQLDHDIQSALNIVVPRTEPLHPKLRPFFDAGISSECLVSGAQAIAPYRNNVTGFTRSIPGAIKPTSAHQIDTIVRVANRNRIPVFPFSTGKNWSLGSKLPNENGTVLLDLGCLDRLLEVDPDQGFARFEPGYTQGMLVDFLALHHPDLMINVTGGHGGLSMMGNCLDRGDGFYGPRHDDALGFKVVLGNGKSLCVGGFWEEDFPDRAAELPGHFHRWGVGPDLKDMMFQSSFGIATEMVFRLMDRQEKTVLFWATAERENLFALVETATKAVRSKLCEEGNSRVGIELENTQNEADPLHIDSIVPRGQVIFNTIICGEAAVVDAQIAGLHARFAASGCVTLQDLHLTEESVSDLGDQPQFIKLIAPMSLGQVVWQRIEPAYESVEARPVHPSQYDLDQTHKGMLGCLPSIPMRHPHLVVQCVELIEHICRDFDLDPVIALEMAGIGMAKLFFDARIPGQMERAQACKEEMHKRMIAAGFIPHRADIEEQPHLVAARASYFEVVANIKRALDPNNIIAPGRYGQSAHLAALETETYASQTARLSVVR
jgi:4-cresol dehydrogenase (hydroxylating)